MNKTNLIRVLYKTNDGSPVNVVLNLITITKYTILLLSITTTSRYLLEEWLTKKNKIGVFREVNSRVEPKYNRQIPLNSVNGTN